jgi:hypothetical protein
LVEDSFNNRWDECTDVLKKSRRTLADIEEQDDNNMPNYSRGYEDDVNNRDHARKRSESGPNSRRWEPCDPHFFFIRGAL